MEIPEKEKKMDEFRAQLRKHGLKVTSQRIAVHEVMLRLVHASADMVTEELARDGKGNVTVASVYNILSQLSMLDIYRHRMSSNNKMYFDVNTARHIHLYDTVNHVHTDVYDDILYRSIEEKLLARRFKGYKIDGMDVQILAHPTRHRK